MEIIETYDMKQSGYSPNELANIEMIFARGHYNIKDRTTDIRDLEIKRIADEKEAQFIGLCFVVEYLCELDGIPNVMDYTKLFETSEEKPKYELCESFTN